MAFNENTRVKIPANLHLCRLGYTYISLAGAKWDENTNIFTEIFAASIRRINPDIDENEVKKLFDNVSLALDNEDLGQAFYQQLTATSGIKLIDFKDFRNNSFHVVTELTCKNGDDEFRPDITLLINGMPLAFIEVKKPNNQEGVIAEKNYSFSAGQYFAVRIEYTDITPAEFAAKMNGYQQNLAALFSQSRDLETEIQKQLAGLSYE